MKQAKIYRNNIFAGMLSKDNNKTYIFRYDNNYYLDDSLPAISLTLPKDVQEYRSDYLFPFFFNLLSEGVNKQLQSRQLKIDEDDSFGLLLATARYDTIGPVSVKEI